MGLSKLSASLLENSMVSKITQHAVYRAFKAELNFFIFKRRARDFIKAHKEKPSILFVENCNVCNARCIFCAYTGLRRPGAVMPLEDFKQYVDQYLAIGGSQVNITPIVGEPLLDSHFFERLDILAQHSQIIRMLFTTNAILMDEEKIEKLLTYGKRLSIYVSLGGFDRLTYKSIMGIDRFDQVQNNIEQFIERKQTQKSEVALTVDLRCPISCQKGPLWDRLQQAEQESLLNLRPTLCFDSWSSRVSVSTLKAAGLNPCPQPYKRGACTLVFTWPTILTDGKVSACTCRDLEGELVIGDMNKSSLEQIWNGEARFELIERQERGDFPAVCMKCTFYRSIYSHWGEG